MAVQVGLDKLEASGRNKASHMSEWASEPWPLTSSCKETAQLSKNQQSSVGTTAISKDHSPLNKNYGSASFQIFKVSDDTNNKMISDMGT